MTLQVDVDVVISLAKAAGVRILEGFSRVKNIETKSSVADLVTQYDVGVEDFLKSEILKQFPGHCFLAEESSNDDAVLTDKPTWIIDPIDGTTNFIHTFPVCCVSIAFANQGTVIIGVVFNPVTEELWWASRGKGAYLSIRGGAPERLCTSGRQKVGESIISTGFCVGVFRTGLNIPEVVNLEKVVKQNFVYLANNSRDIRRIGSAACDLCYVAMGRTDAYFEFGVREWDIAAGLVILEESGGTVTSVNGSKLDLHARNFLAASTKSLATELSEHLVDVDMLAVNAAVDRERNCK